MRWSDLRAGFRAHPMWGDAIVLLLCLPNTLMGTLSMLEVEMPYGAALALGLLFTLPLLWRRTAPEKAAAVLVLPHLVQLVVYDSLMPANITVPLMLYAVSRYGRASRSRHWFVLALLSCVAAGWDWGMAPSLAHDGLAAKLSWALAWFVACLSVSLTAWFLGQWLRQRQATLDSWRERAEALERERAQGMRLVAEEERNRIAREMHDIVAHSLSVIVVQSDGAGYLAGHDELGDPAARLAQVRQAIETINATAREALGETRRLVGVLRQDGEAPELAPAATLERIGELVAQLQQAGIPARCTTVGDPAAHPPLSTGAEMAAYRVVQESLTNVMKHAGPGASVDVCLAHSPEGLDVAVRDTGRGATTSDGQGHGVVGMRERVAAWGGTLVARPRAGGGFEVLAHIPSTGENR
ncbi:sensor histidine kinase [Luteococcus peritonei]|uniref:histidine kinase n=1 Tax=Luteococcus peritonei TaxID=88874 RepID=A0ABW4RY75_9ACTN